MAPPFIKGDILIHTPGGRLATIIPAEEESSGNKWLVEVPIGTPDVTLKLELDTGSSNFWVRGPTTDPANGSKTSKYDTSSSSSAKHVPGVWAAGYGDGDNARGDIYKEVVKIGEITIPDQAIGVANTIHMKDSQTDGIIGLGWPENNMMIPPQKTLMQTLVDERIIVFPYFTVFLGNPGEKSFYTFGWPDFVSAGVKEPTIWWAHVASSEKSWRVDLKSVVVNGETMQIPNRKVLIDTGRTLTVLSEPLVKHIYSHIEGWKRTPSGDYIFPHTSRVPDIQLGIGESGRLWTFHPRALPRQSQADGYVYGSIQVTSEDKMVLGDSFLRNVYAVFDVTKHMVGFAQR